MEQRTNRATVEIRRRWLVWLIPCLLVLQLLAPSRAWIMLIISLGGTLAASYVWARQMATRVSLAREQRYGWMHVGDLLEEQFTLVNQSWLPVPWVEIDDRSDLPGYNARSVRAAPAGQAVTWRTEGVCRRRGLFTLGPWQARLGDPFGLFHVTLDYPESRSILVYPPVVHLPLLPLPRGLGLGASRTSRRAQEVTTNAASIRPSAPGDSLNRIHWPSTARLNKLMAKTFDLEPSGDLWIVLDLHDAVQAGAEEESTAEYGIVLAASLADRTLRENRAVGLVAYGRRRDGERAGEPLPTLVLPQKGAAQQWHMLRALATVHAGGGRPLDRVLAEMDRNLGRGMTLAVITPSTDPAWVAGLLRPRRRGIAPVALLLDAESFGEPRRAPGEGSTAALHELLANLGIPAHVIGQGMPFTPLVERKRQGRPEYRVLPGTGRVVAVEG